MTKILKDIFKLNFYTGRPLKYRESNYTLAELERRLIAEVNGFRG